MGQKLGVLWDRIQGKRKVRQICDGVFDQCAEGGFLALDKLHLATLLVYESINKHFSNSHKDSPSREKVGAQVEELRRKKTEKLDREMFHGIISRWIRKDLHILVANKIALALLAAPVMAAVVKYAGKRVPRIGNVVEKISARVLVPACTIGLVIVQDGQV